MSGWVQDMSVWLAARGVDTARLCHPPLGPVKVARIRGAGDGLFDYDNGGEPAFLHIILDRHYDAYDVAAWTRHAPRLVLRRAGVATWLGEAALDVAQIEGWRLRVHATPLAWLKAGGDGAVMLEPVSCRYDLMALDTVVAETMKHAETLHRLVKGEEIDGPAIKVAAPA